MKTKLLKRLKNKHGVMGTTIHIISYIYSPKSVSRHPKGFPEDAKWYSYSWKKAHEKSIELILNEVDRIRNGFIYKLINK